MREPPTAHRPAGNVASAGTGTGTGTSAGDASLGRLTESLQACRQPWLIGVRHHSPALSVVMPALLQEADPDLLLVELPPEATPWLQWLTHPETVTPVALALAGDDTDLGFYPFAEFSPELVALRWASAHRVPVVCCDRPIGCRTSPGASESDADGGGPDSTEPTSLSGWESLLQRYGSADDLWDRLVESRSPGAGAEQLRVAALAVGAAHRAAEQARGGVDPHTLARERWMRHALASHPAARPVAVIGAFHAPALLPTVNHAEADQPEPVPQSAVRASLVGYSAAQLDSRSGYPAGIRDPAWQQAVLEAGGDPDRLSTATTRLLTAIGARLRADKHPAGPGEIRETVRMAVDLARLRGLPAPGRRELVEALTSVHAQGEVIGRGRAVARAAETVLVGDRHGHPAPGTPRSALAEWLVAELTRLGLPVTPGWTTELRLQPGRSGRDTERVVMLHRLQAARIHYAAPVAISGRAGADTVAEVWRARMSAATAATVELAAVHGPRLDDCVRALVRLRVARQRAADGPTPTQLLDTLHLVARCALPDLVGEQLDLAARVLPERAVFADLVTALGALADLRTGRVPGLGDRFAVSAARVGDRLEECLSRELDGIAGSDATDDAVALVRLAEADPHTALRLRHGLQQMRSHGSPLMQGGAVGVLLRLDLASSGEVGTAVAGWLAGAVHAEARTALRRRLAGLVITAGGLLEAGDDLLESLSAEVEATSDERFVALLPSLRGGFDPLSPADRHRLLAAVAARHGAAAQADLDADPEHLAVIAARDLAAGRRLAALGLADAAFSPAERWRLMLGVQRERLSAKGRRTASSLDQLYGNQHGEGAAAERAGRLGGREAPSPGARRWGEDLDDLFGADVREEVLADAAALGRPEALELLDIDRARASVELLSTVLSLAGALPEARLARLRPLVARMVDELSAALATRLRPSLTGIELQRPTRRDTGVVNLAATVAGNLDRVQIRPDGRPRLVPERPVFVQRAARHADWHVIVVVDVSGSMEASTVFAAITSAILAGVRCLRVSFVAFSTEVIDLSDRVSDPLALLLEISVGGGTSISTGLAYAADLVRVPNRTLLALVTDFEEGGSVTRLIDQVRALAASGVRLLGCAALDDTGGARYQVGIASAVAAAGMPVAAVSPQQLARWVADTITGSRG